MKNHKSDPWLMQDNLKPF